MFPIKNRRFWVLLFVLIFAGSAFLYHKISDYNNRKAAAKHFIGKVILKELKPNIIDQLKKEHPKMSDKDISHLSHIRLTKIIEEESKFFAGIYTVEDFDTMIEYYLSEEGKSVINKDAAIKKEVRKKFDEFIITAKKAYDNHENDIKYQHLLYDENPKLYDLKKLLLDCHVNKKSPYIKLFIQNSIEKTIKEYPETKRKEYKKFMEETLSDVRFYNISINTMMHYYTEKEFEIYAGFLLGPLQKYESYMNKHYINEMDHINYFDPILKY